MKEMFKKRKWNIITICIVVILILVVICFALKTNKKDNKPIHKEEIHNMFVKINPLVKLTFKEEYYLCNDNNKTEVCGEQTNKVIGYELINDDAKTFYKDLEFTNKDLYQVLLMLCETARDNDVGFEKLEITTDSDNITNENILDYLKKNSKYEISYSVYVNFEEHINEDNILKDENIENKIYLVTFDSDGGNKVENQIIDKGNKASKPDNPTKDGYKFVEWKLDGKTYDFDLEINEDITLKAKWEKEKDNSSNTNNQTKPSSNSNSNVEASIEKTDENIDENNKTNDDETSSENTPGDESNDLEITSTIDKINLNDNILVTHGDNGSPYDPQKCGSTTYYFATNFQEIFKDYIHCSSTGKCSNSVGGNFADYPDLFSELSFDLNKEEQVKQQFDGLNIPKGINNWEYSFSNHGFTYSYSDIYIYNPEKYGTFGNNFNSNIDNFRNQINNILNGSYNMSNLSCGDYGNGPELLTEELCEEFNLTCDRW